MSFCALLRAFLPQPFTFLRAMLYSLIFFGGKIMNYTILIADDNSSLANGLKDFFDRTADFTVVGIAEDGVKALEMVSKFRPDFLLLDIVMPKLDGFGVLAALEDKKPIVVMMSQLASDGFVQKAMQYGASYFLAKPFDCDSVCRLLTELSSPKPAPKPVSVRRNKSLDERISNLFISVGIPAHIKGYQFLREAIKMTIETPDIINSITKRLYPAIAERYCTSASKVERAIRHAIEVAWNRGKIENINNIFGIKIYSPNEKPTNGEFIALIADKLLLESA